MTAEQPGERAIILRDLSNPDVRARIQAKAERDAEASIQRMRRRKQHN